MGRTDEGSQPLGGEQQLRGILGQAFLPFASTSQVYKDVIVVRQAAHFVIWQARLEPAERTDDDTLGRVPKVYYLIEAFGTDPVTTLQNLGLPLFQVVPIVANLTLQLIRHLRLHGLFRRLARHLELGIQSFVDMPN